MLPLRVSFYSLMLLLALAGSASAQDAGPRVLGDVFPQGFEQAVYKGVVGNVLDAIPMDPSKRLDLQRTNAVVGNTLLGRSLTVLAGLSNPILLVGGFVWGMWAASNIKPVKADVQLTAEANQSGRSAAAAGHIAALLDHASAPDDAPANRAPAPILVSSISAGYADASSYSSSRVVKIWLPQRSSTLPQ
jgi:hypothetical protein